MDEMASVAAKVIATEAARRPPAIQKWWRSAARCKGIRVKELTIRRAEERLGCSLPEPYRMWLREIGYGIGPFGGLFPTETPHARAGIISATEWGTFTVQPIFDLGLDDRPNGFGECPDINGVTAEFIVRLNSGGRASFSLKSARGIIAINDGGNGSYYGLVVVGPLRGTIVQWLHDSHVFGQPPEGRDFGAVLLVPRGPRGFLAWLDQLVDEETERARRIVGKHAVEGI
jgi:hypothetical protein